MNEYSPAVVLAKVPPMMCWLPAISVSSGDVPGFPLKKRKMTAPTANSGGPGLGMRETPPEHVRRRPAAATGPSAVTILNAMLYGRTTSIATIVSAGSGK